MRKIFVVAAREYLAAVRTKAFIIGLLIMPIMMGGSIVVQTLLRNFRDTGDKTFVVIDRTPGQSLRPALDKAVAEYNKTTEKEGKQTHPRFVLEDPEKKGPPKDAAGLEELRLALSRRVKKGELTGFLEIGPEAAELRPGDPKRAEIRYQSNRPTYRDFVEVARNKLTTA